MTLALLGQISGPVIAICAVVGVVMNWRKSRVTQAKVTRLEGMHPTDGREHPPEPSPSEVVHLPPLWPENPDWRETPSEVATNQAREDKLRGAADRAKQAASEEM